MKKLINSNYFKWFRKAYLKIIYKTVKLSTINYCCHIKPFHSLFICWKDLKEVEENMKSEHLRTIFTKNEYYTCSIPWFENKESRLAFLEECLNKLK